MSHLDQSCLGLSLGTCSKRKESDGMHMTFGSLAPKPSGRRKPLLLEPYAETLANMVEADHDITRRYGRCTSHLRLVAKARYSHRNVISLVAGLRIGGVTAPLMLDGSMTGAAFRAYAE